MTWGYYSLIQYCPDFSRAEAANVGLVLFQTDPANTAVQVLDDLRSATRRLGHKHTQTSLRRDVDAIRFRILNEQFASIEALEQFVRTRGNQLILTPPRPMRVTSLAEDAQRLFKELVGPSEPSADESKTPLHGIPLLRTTFLRLHERLPDRVFLDREFHASSIGITIHADYAFKNSQLNVVREVATPQDPAALQLNALGLSKEGELVRHLDEGSGQLIVVCANQSQRLGKQEDRLAELLGRLDATRFVRSTEVEAFAHSVEADLEGH